MAARKVTEDMIDRLAEWDLEGYGQEYIAKQLGIATRTVSTHLKRVRAERREIRNHQAEDYLYQLDRLKREMWIASRSSVEEVRVDDNGVTTTTKGPPIAAARLVLDCIMAQCKILGYGADRIDIHHKGMAAPQVVMVSVKNREELKKAMTLQEFRAKTIPMTPGRGKA